MSTEKVPFIRGKLAERMMETTFEEDELADQPVMAQP